MAGEVYTPPAGTTEVVFFAVRISTIKNVTISFDKNGAGSGGVPQAVTQREGISYAENSTVTFPEDDMTLYSQWKDIVPPGDIPITGICAIPDSFTVTWDDPADADLKHVSVSVAIEGRGPGSAGAANVSKGKEEISFSGRQASSLYTVSFSSIDNTGNASDEIILLIKTPETGSGELAYTLISNRAGLEAMESNLSGAFVLMSDIDLTDSSWTPIGNKKPPFAGVFNGDNHKIANMKIDNTWDDYYGLFGYISNGDIHNLGLAHVNVNGYNYTVTLAGYMADMKISGCHVRGSVHGNCQIGGLRGCSASVAGVISDCSFDDSVESKSTGGNGDPSLTALTHSY